VTPLPETSPITTDALVIGAGPVGLFQVFELGLVELQAHVVDALPQPGGQCTELYPDKPIYDIPGLPVVSGQALVAQLLAQAAPFKPQFHLGQLVAELQALPDGRWQVATDAGTRFIARTVFIAAGTGAFVPRSVALDGLADHLGRQIHYRWPDAASAAGRQVLVLGDEEPALQQAITLAELPAPQRPARITLVHRREQFRADEATQARFQALRAEGALHFVAGQPSALVRGPAGTLCALDVLPPAGDLLRLPVDTLLIRMGLSPRLGPVADWGLSLHRRQLVVDTERFQTSAPGIFAVGDINTYPGKRKLLLCGFHEATLAAFAAAALVRGQPVPLQYTTTSTRLHELLGVAPAADGHQT
jgi:thioredoxin reductase (NADPH)